MMEPYLSFGEDDHSLYSKDGRRILVVLMFFKFFLQDSAVESDARNIEMFSEYYQSIFYSSNQPDTMQTSTRVQQSNSDSQVYCITYKETLRAIKWQKPGKAIGCDGISAEMLKAAPEVTARWLNDLFNAIIKFQH